MCHRDLKPDNIFVGEKKNGIYILKIGDFGCARQDLLNGIKNNILSA
jgi:serine/threonine protein kinase